MSSNVEQHEQWLEQLTIKSKKKQEQFINKIAKRLGHPAMTEHPNQPFRGAPDFWQQKEWTLEERVTQFTENFKQVGGHVSKFESIEDASLFIVNKANELGAKKIVRNDELLLEQLDLEHKVDSHMSEVLVWNSNKQLDWKSEAAQSDFGIVRAEAAIAYTGSVVVQSSAQKGRAVSLLPTVLFIIIPESCLVTRLGEVLTTYDVAGRTNLPAGIHFISGPSRSSDIENDLTIGVHGPGVVFALIVKDI